MAIVVAKIIQFVW